MYPMRSAGRSGSSGTYAPCAFHTARNATISSGPRSSRTPTVVSAPTPAARSRAASADARASNSAKVRRCSPATTAQASGSLDARRSIVASTDSCGRGFSLLFQARSCRSDSPSGRKVAVASPSGSVAIATSTARYSWAIRPACSWESTRVSVAMVMKPPPVVTENGESLEPAPITAACASGAIASYSASNSWKSR